MYSYILVLMHILVVIYIYYIFIYIYIYIYIYCNSKKAISANCLNVGDPLLQCKKIHRVSKQIHKPQFKR